MTEPASRTHSRYDFRNATLIGRGEYARVYCVTDKHLSQKAAVKVQEKSKYEGKKINPLESEVQALGTLSHPNIVTLYEYWEEASKDYIVLQYARGGELLNFVTQRGPLPEPLLRNVFGQIVRAVEYAHFRQFSHRDIKLENIFLLNDMAASGTPPHALLGDWGFATRFEPGVPQTIACGSLHYTSPEVATKQAYLPDKADMWSLGVVLYALAFAEFPFDSQDTRELTVAIQQAGTDGPYSIARKVATLPRGSSALKELVLSLLEANVQKRLTATETLAHRFFTSEGFSAADWQRAAADGRSIVRSSPSLHSNESLCSLVSSASSASARLSRQNSSSSIRPTDPAQSSSCSTTTTNTSTNTETAASAMRSRAARTCRLHVDMVKEIAAKPSTTTSSTSRRRARRKAPASRTIALPDDVLSWSGDQNSTTSTSTSTSISKSHSRSKSPKVASSSQVSTTGGKGKTTSRRTRSRETKKAYASRSSAQLDLTPVWPPPESGIPHPPPTSTSSSEMTFLRSSEPRKVKPHSRRTVVAAAPVPSQEPSKPSPFSVLLNLIKHGRPTKNNGIGPHTN